LIAVVLLMVNAWRPLNATPEPANEVRKALAGFIEAFNNLDWEAFRGWIAADATLFNPEIPEATSLARVDGKEAIERSFRSVFEATKRNAAGPPYLYIVPRKVRVQMLERVAVATFEFDRAKGSIGRRTFVFRKQGNGWKIVHIHASNTAAHD
jgi:ketosteroid isomerase-like protein